MNYRLTSLIELSKMLIFESFIQLNPHGGLRIAKCQGQTPVFSHCKSVQLVIVYSF